MARIQSKKRRLLGLVKPSSNSTSGLATSPGRSQARAGNLDSTSGTTRMASEGTLARMRRFFHRLKRGPSTTVAMGTNTRTTTDGEAQERDQLNVASAQGAVDIITGGGAEEQRVTSGAAPAQDVVTDQVEPEPTLASAGKVVDAAVIGFDNLDPTSRISKGAVDFVGRVDAAFIGIENLSDRYLKPFRVFNQVVATLTHVHPYAQIALGILTSAAQLIINQANLDKAVSDLLDSMRSVYEFLTEEDNINNIDRMRGTLARLAQAISDSALFIKDYSATKSFWKRAGRNIFFETQTVVDDHVKTLNGLMQQYRDCVVRDIQINTCRIFEDLNLEGMAYAKGAGVNTTKKCLEGTRKEIIKEIISWITDPDVDAPRILWLHGQAGRGKSAIAHTIALWIKDVGGLGSCFCFARDREAERREEKILTTIARDLADRDPAFRRALANAVSKDHSLKTTPDVVQQWRKLILGPLSTVNGMIIGNVVVVIDALDESGPDISREHILSLLASSEAADLPSNFRVLLTSRPLPDIKHALTPAAHVKAVSLEDIPAALAERDIRLYASTELRRLPEIGITEIQSIAQKSDGLFEWARLACRFIKPNRPGRTVMERYLEIMSPSSGGGGALLDAMYRTILEDTVPQDGVTLARFRSAMQQVMSTFEPLQLNVLNEMRKHFPSKDDHFDMTIILEFMAPLLGGITDRHSVVRPLHASFYDFLTDHHRSGVFFLGASTVHSLAFASLHTLCNELKFNICGLESSYCNNSEITDLQKRIHDNISPNLTYSCQYWAYHLEKTMLDSDSSLGNFVKGFIGSEKILFWLETLSLLDGLGHATGALVSTITWLQHQQNCLPLSTAVQPVTACYSSDSMTGKSPPV
ncbi:hypothetical protein PISMIDRAFT_12997 [Pisolithus microcarpus 441]|uniref:NACHT domain-containing protein n=1 Tax=Pisolithus microcarpus 441 TaxID=765257 RepID=A0A0C9YUJ8_9AGAM|nr:hypothetical protein PISMIDRAFT_12997 [Pisolithus microcarpus 441]